MGLMSAEYAAGFFDGEGNLRIEYSDSKRQRHWARLAIAIGQNDPTPLLLLQERWGGQVKQRLTALGRLTYTWRIQTRQAELFLHDIQPFLIVKAEASAIALELRMGATGVSDMGGSTNGRRGLSEQEGQRRRELKERLHVVTMRRGRREEEAS